MFAPAHHQATRFVIPVRRELAVRTIFNMLGPLTNPAGARRQLIGVSDPGFLETMAGALARLGVDRALVVSSEDGLDEISAVAPTKVVEVNGEEITQLPARRPRRPGRARRGCRRRGCGGGTPAENAAVTRAILAATPRRRAAGRRGLALINAGAAIYAAGGADTIAEGVEAARAALAEGSAARRWSASSQASRRLRAARRSPDERSRRSDRARADPAPNRARSSRAASARCRCPSAVLGGERAGDTSTPRGAAFPRRPRARPGSA